MTYFLAKTNRISFFPTYLIGLSVLGLISANEITQVLTRNRTALTILSIFLAYAALTVFWSNDAQFKTFALYTGYGLLIITFVIAIPLLAHRFPWFIDVFLRLLVLAAVISCCYSLCFYYLLDDYRPLGFDRLYSLGGLHNPVVSALSYGAALVLVLSFASICRDNALKVLTFFIGILLLAGIMHTGTRSVWIGLIAAGLCVIAVLPNPGAQKKLVLGVVGLTCLLIAGVSIWILGYHEALLERSTSFRPQIWVEFLTKIVSGNFFLGFGINTDPAFYADGIEFKHAHSIYLSTLFYGGIVGLGLFLTLIGQVIYTQVKNPTRLTIYVLPLLVFGLVCLVFDGNRLVRKVDFTWLLIWLPIALSLVDDTETKTPPA